MLTKTNMTTYLILSCCLLIIGCSKDGDDPKPHEHKNEIVEVKSLQVHPQIVSNALMGNLGAENAFWLYSLDEGKVIPSTDGKSDNWDIALFPHNMLAIWMANCGSFFPNTGPESNFFAAGGKGKAGFVLVEKSFDEVTTIPEGEDFTPKGEPMGALIDSQEPPMIGWYKFGGEFGDILTPLPNRTFIIKTNKGKFAKLQIQSIYKDNPATPTQASKKYYLTFRYFLQKDGSTNLNTSTLGK